jgi:signal transduction histidine kinase
LLGVDFLASQIGEEQDGIHKVLGQMRIAVSRADDIVRGMLDFSTAHQLVLQDVSLNPVIEQALRLVRFQLNRRGINLEREFSSELPAVSMDCNKMEQVFINLFLNAIQAMPKGGTLTVKTRMVEIQCLTLNQPGNRRRSASGESYVVAEILDTGCGIPSDQISKIFDPFFTTKPAGEGTGLGLTVVHNIIQLHGGNIDIRNRPEGGVKATLCLKTKTHDKT